MKTMIRQAAKTLGFDIRRAPRGTGLYDAVIPGATYSPWNEDEGFKEVCRRIQGATLVDKYRCFELWSLVEQSAKLTHGALIEVGVWRGGTGALIAKRAQQSGIRDHVFLCDTFHGVVKAGTNDSAYVGGEHSDTSRSAVERLLFEDFQLNNVKILQGVFPEETAHQIETSKFRFCHIDVDVYQSAADVVDWIWDRLVPGGMIVYDDYGFQLCDGIRQQVEEQRRKKDGLLLHNLNGHAVIVKL